MPALYLDNDSYPELRDVPRGLARSATWWRAILHAARHQGLWLFFGLQAAIVVALVAATAAIHGLRLAGPAELLVDGLVVVPGLVLMGYLQTSLGGDLMRPHLRAVSDVARHACPSCGHCLRGHLGGDVEQVQCPECGHVIAVDLFAAPYRVPRRYRAFPPRLTRDRAG
ncbi:MAG: TFIIB-type zinc ribbon-containing protein [Planctomycetota bacterium]